MPNVVKQMIVRELVHELEGAEGLVFVRMGGLTVAETEALRGALAEHGVPLRMVPNRLARRALAERGIEASAEALKGNVALAWGDAEGAILAAKSAVASPPAKAGKVGLLGGYVEGRWLGPADAAELAAIPSRDELRAMLLGVISGPARSLVGIVHAPGSSLARVVQARSNSAGGEEAAA